MAWNSERGHCMGPFAGGKETRYIAKHNFGNICLKLKMQKSATEIATIRNEVDLPFTKTTDYRYNRKIKKHIYRCEDYCILLFSPLTATTKHVLFTKLLHARRRKFKKSAKYTYIDNSFFDFFEIVDFAQF